ncbi:hypothetical protein PYCC9005_001072 [Savitreella phatthalungensis]
MGSSTGVGIRDGTATSQSDPSNEPAALLTDERDRDVVASRTELVIFDKRTSGNLSLAFPECPREAIEGLMVQRRKAELLQKWA